MIRSVKFCFLLLLIYCYSCNDRASTKGPIPGDIEIIKIELPGQDSLVHLSNFVTSVKVIPLEFSDQSIVGKVVKTKVYNDRIYIQDKYHTSLLVFDIHGKFLHSIGTQGRGKSEYFYLTGFDVNERGVFIYNNYPSEVHHFDYEGKNLGKSEKIDTQGSYFAMQDDFYYLYLRSPGDSKYELDIYSSDFKKHVGYFPSNPDFQQGGITGLFSGTSSDGSIPFYVPLNDTIYMLNKDEIMPSYFIDFGKKRISDGDRLELYKNMDRLNEVSLSKDFAFDVSNVQNIDDFLFFNYYYSYMKHSVFYNKKNKTAINSYNIFDDISNMIFVDPIAQYKNQLIGIYYPHDISINIKFIQRLLKENGRVTDQGRENLKLLENLSKDVFSANAFVIFYTL